MKEQDLKDLGFKKVKVSAEESGGDPFHYYEFQFFKNSSRLGFISGASDSNKDWSVFFDFEYENRIRFTTKKDLKKFIELIKNNDTRNKRKKA